MITRKVDEKDARAGFAAAWVRAIASTCDRLHVITWQESRSEGLPPNVTLIQLSGSRWAKIVEAQRRLWKIMPQVDGIFCHMNPEYTMLAAPAAQWFKRRLVAWYTHRAVNWRRRLMELLADRIVTASPESFRRPYSSKKVFVLGHGIDTQHFRPAEGSRVGDRFNVLTVGRISPAKRIELMIDAVKKLNDPSVQLAIVGEAALPADETYKKQLQQQAASMNVHFRGAMPHRETAAAYQQADLFINVSDTGSLDKAVLEAMACGCTVLTSNEAFKNIVPSDMFLEHANAESLAEAIKRIKTQPRERLREQGLKLREIVVRDHGIGRLASRIIEQFTQP